MMKTSNTVATWLCAAALVLAAGSAPAQDPAAAPQSNSLAAVEFLLGTWQAEGQTPGMGKFTVHRQYQRLFGGSFIEMREVMRGERRSVNARAILGIDPLTGKLTMWWFDADGTITEAAHSGSVAGSIVFAELSGARLSMIKKTPDGFEDMFPQPRRATSSFIATLQFSKAAVDQDFSGGISGLPPPDSPLAPLSKFAGAWHIEGESDGQPFVVEYAFQWTLGGRFMTTTYSIGQGGPPQLHAISVIGYDPATKHLIQRGFNAEGSVLRAKVTVRGDTFTFEGRMAGEQSRELRTTYTLVDEDTLELTPETKNGDKWESQGALPMRRHKH